MIGWGLLPWKWFNERRDRVHIYHLGEGGEVKV